MDARLLARALAQRRRLAQRDRWTQQQITDYQHERLAELRRWAVARSPFYARHHAGLDDAPLDALPPVTKSQLMEGFDDVLTDRSLTLRAVEGHLRELHGAGGDPGPAWRGRWRVAATAGTTGVRGVFAWDEREWATVVASYGRATTWAGIPAGPTHRMRMAVVSSRDPTHQSAVVAASVRSPLVPTLRLAASAPLPQTIDALNEFQPQVLVGYASVLRPLAFAQLDGALKIRPRAVMSASEVLSPGAASVMAAAWQSAPFDVYAATETAGIASTCDHGRRHTYDDLVIVEPVDAHGSPVPAGTVGARLLVTVLFTRTLPLIRYELSDRVALGTGVCPCGRAFGLLDTILGRAEDTLRTAASHGRELDVDVIRSIVEQIPIEQWQLAEATAPGELRLLVVRHGGGLDTAALGQRLRDDLAVRGHHLRLHIDEVPELPRTPLGKAVVLPPKRPGSAS